jgi:hypothetical protein
MKNSFQLIGLLSLCFLLIPIKSVAQKWDSQEIQASDAHQHASFGTDLSIDKGIMAVGAARDEEGLDTQNSLFRAGAVYLYKKKNDQWIEAQKVVAPIRKENALFGNRLQLSDSFLFVGTFNEKVEKGLGRVYVYKVNSNGQAEYAQTIEAPDSTIYFGWSLCVNESQMAIGAMADSKGLDGTEVQVAGAVYIFSYRNDSWSFNQKLVHPNRDKFDQFGVAIDLLDSTMALGVPQANDSQGECLIFTKDNNGKWMYFQTLSKRIARENDMFAHDVRLSKDLLLCGAQGEDYNTDRYHSNAGAVYVYEKYKGFWTFKQRIVQTSPIDNSEFGSGFEFYGNQLLISAHGDGTDLNNDSLLSNCGSLYLIGDTSGSLNRMEKIVSPNRKKGANFGNRIAVNGAEFVVSSHKDYNDVTVSAIGKVYSFKPEVVGIATSAKTKLSLYPNPNNGKFHLTLPLKSESCTIQVYDPLGRAYLMKPARGGEVEFNLDLIPGVYYIELQGLETIGWSSFIVR